MASINKKIRQSKENQKETNTIAQILEKQGYDEVLVALGKDGAMGTAIKGKNESTPYILYKLFDDMCNADKLIFMALALGMGKENSERRINVEWNWKINCTSYYLSFIQ